jgi:hypothetical protein
MEELNNLKAAAYDCLAQIECLQQKLRQINEQIQIKTNELNGTSA